jgi:Undecaprenyl-phosphate glucose phosphotransferase
MAAIEFLAVAVAAYLGSLVYHRFVLLNWPVAERYVPAALLIATLVLSVSIGFQHYSTFQTQPRHLFLWHGVGAVALAFSFFLSAMFLLKIAEDYSRGTFLFQILSVGIALLAARATLFSRLQSAIASGLVEARRVVLIGDVNHCSHFADQLRAAGVLTVRSFLFPARSDTKTAEVADVTVARHRKFTRLVELCRRLHADDIVILAGRDDLPMTAGLAGSLSELPVGVHIVPVDSTDLLATARTAEFGNTVTLQVSQPPLSTFDRIIKRTFDIVAATAGLIAVSPLFLIVPLVIKLDSRGPVFFRQTRHGYNNEPIRVFKFRTMITTEEGDRFTQAVKNDPRVTRIGRVLRHTSVDELPQLFNVLSGEMSIVGPRPHATAHNKRFEKKISPFKRRHNVKPGITGWAQVNGYRGQTDTLEKMQRRIEYDLYYIDNWSFLFDIKIIIMTLFSKRTYMNAY